MPKTNGQYRNIDFFVRVLSDDGTTSGVTNFNTDFSVTPATAFMQPPVGEVFFVTSLQITIGAGGNANQLDYGNLTGPLTNGVDIRATLNGVNFSLLQRILRDNNDILNFGGSAASIDVDFAGTSDTLSTQFNSANFLYASTPGALRLNGDFGDQLQVVLNDNFTGLNLHEFFARGWV